MSADGMPEGDMERALVLERRYRRLLGCYPPGHREVHQEEMLGVLLATARPGQRAPGVRETANLVRCGLAIRAGRALGVLAAKPWRDALAVVSLIAPVVLLIIAALAFAAQVRVEAALHQNAAVVAPYYEGGAAETICWLAVVLLGLTGRRRAAAMIALVPLVVSALVVLDQAMQLSGAWPWELPMALASGGMVASVFMASLAACSLAFSAGPRRGLAIVGGRQACFMIAGLSSGSGFLFIVFLLHPTELATPAFYLLSMLAIAAAAAIMRAGGPVDRRVAVLAGTGLLLNFASSIMPFAGSVTATVAIELGSLLLVLLMWPLAIASFRGQAREALS